jgi:hypothetical protein
LIAVVNQPAARRLAIVESQRPVIRIDRDFTFFAKERIGGFKVMAEDLDSFGHDSNPASVALSETNRTWKASPTESADTSRMCHIPTVEQLKCLTPSAN